MAEVTKSDTPAKTSITFVSRCAPYGLNRANLCLDMALASAVFEQDVTYIFLGDGVFQLLKGQDGAAIGGKTLGNALETLALYGIEKVYVDRQALIERGIDESDLLPDLRIADRDEISGFISGSDTVFNL